MLSQGYIEPVERALQCTDIIRNNNEKYTISLYLLTKIYNEYGGNFDDAHASICSEILHFPCLIRDFGDYFTDEGVIEATECFKFLINRGYSYHYNALQDGVRSRLGVYADYGQYADLCAIIYLARYRVHIKEIREFIVYYFGLFPEINDDHDAKLVIARAIISSAHLVDDGDEDEVAGDNTGDDTYIPDSVTYTKYILGVMRDIGISLNHVYYEALNCTMKEDVRGHVGSYYYYRKYLEIGVEAGLVISNNELEILKYSHFILWDDYHFNSNILRCIVAYAIFFRNFHRNEKKAEKAKYVIWRFNHTVLVYLGDSVREDERKSLRQAIIDEINGTVTYNSKYGIYCRLMLCIHRIMNDEESFYLANTADAFNKSVDIVMNEVQSIMDNAPKLKPTAAEHIMITRFIKNMLTNHVLSFRFELITSRYTNNRYIWKALSFYNFSNSEQLKKMEEDHNNRVKTILGAVVKQGIDATETRNSSKWNNIAHLAGMIAEY